MHHVHRFGAVSFALVVVVAGAASTSAVQAQVSPGLLDGLRWRMIGPFRGGRTKAATGVPGEPNVFYIGAVDGGVWRSTDYGRTWDPIFDAESTGSIGAIAVAPSDPNVIYVGSGEGLQRPDLSVGDGIYRSDDAGKTWTHLGLRDGQQIPQIIIDPRDPNRLFVAVLGHPYGPSVERGIFRSTDGGKTFQKVLYKDEYTGGVDLAFGPRDPNTVYAALWQAQQAPWEYGAFNGPGSGLYKSTDGGTTWRQLTKGLPTYADGLGRIGIAVAASDPNRMYATVQVRDNDGNGYLFRSDDAGESWYRVAQHYPFVVRRPDDFAEVKVDPKNPDVVYTASVATWKSTDGGKTFTAIKGAPGGDDYHRLWINPDDPNIILLVADQGAAITVNGGKTWSSWYNQPTAQFYHVTTDNAFPYRICGGQQESGSACVASRSDDGAITFRDWHPVGTDEYAYIAPDPLDPDIVYAGRDVTRYDRRSGETERRGPKPLETASYRLARSAPLVFSAVDPHLLYFASNVMWQTRDGGEHWTQISPDLTRQDSVVPPNVGLYGAQASARARHPGVIYTIAPSYLTTNVIWEGSDDGLIHVTRDGGTRWTDVTPPGVRARPWSRISLMDASHFDSLSAYVAVNDMRLDDWRPHIYCTHDGGTTWTEITTGIAPDEVVNVVREDPERKGLLFAGTERQVYVSFDDGDHWQSLRRNMPATSVRDLVIKGNDLVAGTHGRGFWILDDITPLRQIDAGTTAATTMLFRPEPALRIRWSTNVDTPLPPEEPAGENPPDGAIIDYFLAEPAHGPVTLEILDAKGELVRRYASTDSVRPPEPTRDIADYWIRPPQILSGEAGAHRFVWDLRYPRPLVTRYMYSMTAIYGKTVAEPRGAWVVPGQYTVRLTVDGRAYTQPLVVRMDPRVQVTQAGLEQELALSLSLTRALDRNFDALEAARALRTRLAVLATHARGSTATAIRALDHRVAVLLGDVTDGGSGSEPAATFASLNDVLETLYATVNGTNETLPGADAAPTPQVVSAAADEERALDALLARWSALEQQAARLGASK